MVLQSSSILLAVQQSTQSEDSLDLISYGDEDLVWFQDAEELDSSLVGRLTCQIWGISL